MDIQERDKEVKRSKTQYKFIKNIIKKEVKMNCHYLLSRSDMLPWHNHPEKGLSQIQHKTPVPSILESTAQFCQ